MTGVIRRCLAAMALFVSLLPPASSRAESPAEPPPAPPIPWQDTGPFARLFLQLPFDAPEPIAPGRFEASLRTLYSNSIARAATADLTVDVSVETAVPAAYLRYGLPRGFELDVTIPGEIGYAGFLARPIKFVEGLVGTVNPRRLGPPPQEARFRILRADGSGVDWTGMGGSPGDPWAGVKHLVRRQSGWTPTLAWRAALKIPTRGLPFGSGMVEVGTGLLASWGFGVNSLRVAADVTFPSGWYIGPALRTRPHLSLQVGAARRFTRRLTATIQGSVHTSALAGTGIDEMDGSAWYLLAGIVAEATRSTWIGFALVENIFHASRGADITGVLELGHRW